MTRLTRLDKIQKGTFLSNTFRFKYSHTLLYYLVRFYIKFSSEILFITFYELLLVVLYANELVGTYNVKRILIEIRLLTSINKVPNRTP